MFVLVSAVSATFVSHARDSSVPSFPPLTMSAPSAILSVSRLSAGIIGLFYGAVHKGTLEGKLAKEQAKHHHNEPHTTGTGIAARSSAETGTSLNPQEHTIPGR